MMKLIKLELIKDNFRKYIIGSIISLLCIISLTILIAYFGDDGEDVFRSGQELFMFGDLLIRSVYLVFSGVMIANIIVSEFKTGTIKNLFVYPIARKRIMASKLILVFSYTFVLYIISAIIFWLVMMFFNNLIPAVPGVMNVGMLLVRLPEVVAGALLTSGISLISLYFGMKKKSVVATIVTSVIITSILSNTTGDLGNNLFSITVIPVCMCLLGVGIAALSFRNINKQDIN